MRVPRRLLPLLACALIAGTPAVAQAQGGAGDDQYQDPFGGSSSGSDAGGGSSSSGSKSGSSTGSSSSGTATQGTSGNAPELTQEPDLGASSSTSTSSASVPATSSSTAAATSRSELPRTGFDAPVVALLGIGLLAAGVGLRLRVAHGRRS